MTRVPVPDDYEHRDVPLPESMNYDNLRSVVGEPGRVAQVREDDDGRYVGVPEQYAAKVADHLGVTIDVGMGDVAEVVAETDADDSEEDVDGSDYEERVANAEGLANEQWQRAVSAVEDGDADSYLDELSKADDRKSVQEAIDERRAELEE